MISQPQHEISLIKLPEDKFDDLVHRMYECFESLKSPGKTTQPAPGNRDCRDEMFLELADMLNNYSVKDSFATELVEEPETRNYFLKGYISTNGESEKYYYIIFKTNSKKEVVAEIYSTDIEDLKKEKAARVL